MKYGLPSYRQPSVCRFNSALFAALVALCTVSGQPAVVPQEDYRLCGKVVNPAGQGVHKATVLLEPLDIPVVTDRLGRFCFESVKPSTYRLTIAASGFQEHRLDSIQVPDDGRASSLHIELSSLRRSDTITVTATRTERRLDEVPIRTEVLSGEQIKQRGAMTLADALDVATGLRVESGCSNCNFTSLRINGLDGSYSQILLDGMPAFSSLDSIYGLEQLPTTVVDRIEIIKGGGSALYGAGAVGGIINVIPRRPTRNGGAFETSLATVGSGPGTITRGYGSFVGAEKRTSIFTFGTFSRLPAYDRDRDGESEVAQRDLQSGGLRFFNALLDDAAELQLGLDLTREYRRGGSHRDLEPHEAEVAEEILSRRSTLVGQWSHFLGTSTFYRLQFAHIRSSHDSYYGVDFDTQAYGDTENPLTSLAATVNHSLGSHDLLAGLQFDRDRITDSRPGYGRQVEQTSRNLGVFVQDDWRVSRQVTLLGGVRLDHQNQTGRGILSPRFSFFYAPFETLQIRATAATGFRPPRIYDEDLHNQVAGGRPGFVVNAPGLREEQVTTTSVSSDFIVAQGDWGGFRVEAHLFHNRLRDTFILSRLPETESEPDRVLFERSNGAGSRISGLELNSDLQIRESFDLEVGWALQRGRLDQPEPEFQRIHFYRFPGHYGYITGRYRRPFFTVGATVSYTGSMWLKHYAGFIDRDRVERTPPFTVVDLRFEFPLKGSESPISLVGNVFNLFDEFQKDYDRGPAKDSAYVYGPRRPRSFALGLRFDF